MIDVYKIREDFPILSKKINNTDLIYLDNAATSQTPIQVIDAISDYYKNYNSNIHRGLHSLSVDATNKFEETRLKVKEHFGIAHAHEIIFTSGTTHGINIISSGLEKMISSKDELIVSEMEHHSNIVPWHFLREKVGVKIKWVDCDNQGNISLDDIKKIVTDKTKFISITQMSNVLGSDLPLKEIIKFSHEKNILVLIDGCQGIAHMQTDVKDLDCDFYVFSGHKLYGPTGVGVLYGKHDILNNLPPWRGGGEMIREVKKESVTFADSPSRFEAGTPNIIQAVGLGAAIDYFHSKVKLGLFDYEKKIAQYFHNEIQAVNKVKVYGKENLSSPMISFTVDGAHPHDIAAIIDREGVAIRAGHHCTQPLMSFFNLNSTARASIGMYTDKNDINLFIKALDKAITFFD